MSSTTQKFWEEQEYFENKEIKQEPLNKDVENILEQFRLLSLEDKVKVKQLLKTEKLF